MIWAEEQWSESKKEKFSYVRLALRELVNNMHPRVEDIFCNAVGGVNSLYAADWAYGIPARMPAGESSSKEVRSYSFL